MKITSPIPRKKARIEIIPLIDIMFFLLAAFMLASLSMIRLHSIRMDLPSARTAPADFRPDILNISVDSKEDIYVGRQQVNLVELGRYVSNRFRMDTNVPVLISGDKAASHGGMLRVLDTIRAAGVQRVSFATSTE